MEPPIRSASFQTSVKCSTCATDVDLAVLADHVCSLVNEQNTASEYNGDSHHTWLTGTPLTVEPKQFVEAPASQHPGWVPSQFKRERPVLPRLDSAVSSMIIPNMSTVSNCDTDSSRRGLDPKEAASIAHDLGLPSPMSAGPGRRSPRTTSSRTRSKSRVARRPPSLDLPISQDCAFPPFPSNKPKRAQTDRDEGPRKPRSASRTGGRSVSRAHLHEATASHSTTSSMHSSDSSGIMKRRTSNSSSNQRSRQGTIDGPLSSMSTAPSSPQLSADGSAHEENVSAGVIPPLPPLEPSISSASTAPNSSTTPITPLWPMTERLVSDKTKAGQPQDQPGYSNNDVKAADLPQQDEEVVPREDHANQAVTFDTLMPVQQIHSNAESMSESAREPSYRTKRPAPLPHSKSFLDSEPALTSVRSPTVPLTGGLGRTLTNLFSRKRSQSTSVKKMPTPSLDSPRMRALAPDPPAIPHRTEGEFGVSDTTEDDYFSTPTTYNRNGSQSQAVAENNTTVPSSSPSPAPSLGSVESDNADVIKPERQDFNFSFQEQESAAEFVRVEAQQPEHDHADVTFCPVLSMQKPLDTDTSRASIDSASSYGSIDFSNRTVSTRSSLMPQEDMRNPIRAALDVDRDSRVPTELFDHNKSQLNVLVPDSLADTPYNHGRLSPVSETESIGWPNVPEDPASPEDSHSAPIQLDLPLQQLPSVVSTSGRPVTPAGTKGVCRGCSQMILVGQKSVSSKDGRLTGRYHKECFGCQTCKEPFATADFYVHEDKPYCSHHYHVVNHTLCGSCGKGIEGQYLETFDVSGKESKKFHSKCLACATCRVQLGDDYFEYHGRIYCERDAFRIASGPRSPYDNAPSRPSPLIREYINSGEPGLKGRFPERRTTRLIMN